VVLLEGMAARCAVVASDLEGYASAAGGLAELVEPGNVTALARALGVALADAVAGEGRSSTESLKAGEAHAENWSMQTLASRYVEFYHLAISRYGEQEARPPRDRRGSRVRGERGRVGRRGGNAADGA
jgi:phosphatidylinositol alpha-mannosyltransferase